MENRALKILLQNRFLYCIYSYTTRKNYPYIRVFMHECQIKSATFIFHCDFISSINAVIENLTFSARWYQPIPIIDILFVIRIMVRLVQLAVGPVRFKTPVYVFYEGFTQFWYPREKLRIKRTVCGYQMGKRRIGTVFDARLSF